MHTYVYFAHLKLHVKRINISGFALLQTMSSGMLANPVYAFLKICAVNTERKGTLRHQRPFVFHVLILII